MTAPNVERTPSVLSPGAVVGGRYEIEDVLGGGGMAVVYRARHVALEHEVALKVVLPEVRNLPGVAERFVREARAASRLKSDHVARVFDVGALEGGAPFFVMELLEGVDLATVVEEGGPVDPRVAVGYAMQACEALAEVHGLGIVHRDLKPGNLFLTRGADGMPHVKLIDFGISRLDAPLASGTSLTQPAVLMGSPRYMAPEQMEDASSTDPRADIWGLGVVLYELLTGRAPYDGGSFLDIYAAVLRGPPRPPSSVRPEVPRALDAIVLRCLGVIPTERFADVSELAGALAPFGPPGSDEIARATTRTLRSARARARTYEGREEEEPAEAPPPVPRKTARETLAMPRERSRRRVRAFGATLVIVLSTLVAFGVRAWALYAGARSREAAPVDVPPRAEAKASGAAPSEGRRPDAPAAETAGARAVGAARASSESARAPAPTPRRASLPAPAPAASAAPRPAPPPVAVTGAAPGTEGPPTGQLPPPATSSPDAPEPARDAPPDPGSLFEDRQ